jgi:hypothetical protein
MKVSLWPALHGVILILMSCYIPYLDLTLYPVLPIIPVDHTSTVTATRHHICIPPPAPVVILVHHDSACQHLGLHHTAIQRAKTNPETRL